MKRSFSEGDTQPIRFVDSESIVDTTFGEHTKMPLPEKSHFQEILETPIPLAHRVAHLIPYIEPTARRFGIDEIATKIGAERSWVRRTAVTIGIIQNDSRSEAGEDKKTYPHLSYELLLEEWEWFVSYERLDDQLSSYAIGRFIARHDSWVEKHAYELGVYPTNGRQQTSGQNSYLYPRTLIPQLRHIILSYMPQEDKVTLGDISQETGMKRSTVKKHLLRAGFTPEKRWSYTTGSLYDFYAEESIDFIKSIISELPPPAGDWLTVSEIADTLSKDYDWVKSRVVKFAEYASERLDNNGKKHLYYPPFVLGALKEEVNVLDGIPFVGDQLTVSGLAIAVRRSQRWVHARLPYIDTKPRDMINPVNNRTFAYYDRKAASELVGLPEDILRIK